MTLAGAILYGAAAAACTAPAIDGNSAGSAVSGDDSGSPAKKPTKSNKSAPATKSPSARQPTGDDDDDSAPATTNPKDPVACMTKCIGTDSEAKAIYTSYASCESKCTATDTGCDDKCNVDVNAQCDAKPDACQKLDTCAAKCPAPGGTTSGGGGLTFADVKDILASACASCHHHDGQFGTLADVQGGQQDILDRIQSGSMPPSDGSFAQSADGKKLIQWLQSGTDLQ